MNTTATDHSVAARDIHGPVTITHIEAEARLQKQREMERAKKLKEKEQLENLVEKFPVLSEID
jgi:hypothetical protein